MAIYVVIVSRCLVWCAHQDVIVGLLDDTAAVYVDIQIVMIEQIEHALMCANE
jgi:hypothetical protein